MALWQALRWTTSSLSVVHERLETQRLWMHFVSHHHLSRQKHLAASFLFFVKRPLLAVSRPSGQLPVFPVQSLEGAIAALAAVPPAAAAARGVVPRASRFAQKSRRAPAGLTVVSTHCRRCYCC